MLSCLYRLHFSCCGILWILVVFIRCRIWWDEQQTQLDTVNRYIANIYTERQEPTVISVLQFWILVNILKMFKKQKGEIHIVLNIVNIIVNLKQRICFTFYSTTYVTTLLKAYSFWVSNRSGLTEDGVTNAETCSR